MSYYNKYLKYNNKYLEYNNIIGGAVGDEAFIKTKDSIKQGKLVEFFLPDTYKVEVKEKEKEKVNYLFTKIGEFTLVDNAVDLSNKDYTDENFIVYYHGNNCNDGITSAWVIYTFFNEKGIKKVKYNSLQASKQDQEKWNKFEDKDSIIIFADVVPSLETYNKLKKNNKKVIIIDHHITNLELYYPLIRPGNSIIFDMNTSGAGLTWKSFFPDKPFPSFVELIIKRDLFRQVDGDNADEFNQIFNELMWNDQPVTDKNGLKDISINAVKKFDEIQKKIESKELADDYFISGPIPPPKYTPFIKYPSYIEKFTTKMNIIDRINNDISYFDSCIEEGKKLINNSLLKNLKYAISTISNTDVYLYTDTDGTKYRVCLIHSYNGDANSLAHMLCNNDFCHFVIMWYYNNEYALKNDKNIVCSLRAWNKFDVSKLAVKYGGGGHANASGGVKISEHPIKFFNLVKINKTVMY